MTDSFYSQMVTEGLSLRTTAVTCNIMPAAGADKNPTSYRSAAELQAASQDQTTFISCGFWVPAGCAHALHYRIGS